MPELKQTWGYEYLEKSKLNRKTLLSTPKPQIKPAPLMKVYETVPRIPIPLEGSKSQSLRELLAKRRSRREYSEQYITLQDLGILLWSAQGVTDQRGRLKLRTAPSAGGLYPIETYLFVNKVKDLASGIYHLNIEDFVLEQLAKGDFSHKLERACLGQKFMTQSAVSLCWSAVLRRNMAKYGHRGMRYIFMDAGHICQNLLLAAEDLELASCPVAAFFDEDLNALLGLAGDEESIIYTAAVGVSN